MKTPKKQPNIVFILSDDQGAWAMHCAGTPELYTPNLDKLAEEGIRFDNFYCSSPVCSPARASILTGRIPSAHGIHDWLSGGNVNTKDYPHMTELGHDHFQHPDKAIPFLEGQPTYVEELARAGYWCALSGKWHVGNSVEVAPGFSQWFTIAYGGCRYYHGDIVENGKVAYAHEYITDIITNRALHCLQQRPKDQPFYLSIHYTAPHSPWTEENHPKEYLDMYRDCEFESVPNLPIHPNQINSCPIGDTSEKRKANLRGYFAAITAMDAGIGRVMDYLSQEGLLEDTIVIFTADNGMNMGHHGVWGKGNGTYPPNMYDSSVKVPFLVRMPGGERKGQVTHRAAKHCDIYPTMMEIAGLEPELGKAQPGKSLLPFLQGQDQDESGDVFICDEYGFVRMYRTAQYKLVRRYMGHPSEFYDLEQDPQETHNLIDAPEHQDRIRDMTNKLETWFETYALEAFDGKELALSGRGQKNRCHEPDAFVPL